MSMLLLINGIFEGIHCRNVGYWVEDYEKAFDLLNQLVTQEWVVERAVLAENGARLHLPVEAFDGQPVLVHMRALQDEWEQLLKTTIPTLPNQPVRQREQYLQLDAYYSRLLMHLRKQLLRDQVRAIRAVDTQPEPDVAPATRQENSLPERTRHLYQQTLENCQRNWRRLQALELQEQAC